MADSEQPKIPAIKPRIDCVDGSTIAPTPSRGRFSTTFGELLGGDTARRFFDHLWFWGAALITISMIVAEYPLFKPHPVGDLALKIAKELGVAAIVSWVVARGIERFARERDHALAQKRADELADNVISGVFGVHHRPTYVKAVIEKNFHPKIVRSKLMYTVRLERFTDSQAAELKIDKDRLMLVHVRVQYRVTNHARSHVPFNIRYIIPVRHGPLTDLAKVTSARFNGDTFPVEAALDKESTTDDLKGYKWPCPLRADEWVDVVINSTLVKEISDTEVFANLHPTEGPATFTMHALPDFVFGARAHTASWISSDDDIDGCAGTWQIEGGLLPNDSVVLWWRTLTDDGQQQAQSSQSDRNIDAAHA